MTIDHIHNPSYPCSCKVEFIGSKVHSIRYCSVHAAAPEMLVALLNLLEYANKYSEEMRKVGRGAGQLGPDAASYSAAGMAARAIRLANGSPFCDATKPEELKVRKGGTD